MVAEEVNHLRVFISYSHDSSEHVDRVLHLSNRLRSHGIDCILDQYEESPPEGFPRWMDRQIRDADFVLMICTSTYYHRVMGEEEPGRGLGVRWEGTLIYQHIYNAGTLNTRFIPVLLDTASVSDIPTPLQGVMYYCPSSEGGYEALYRRLTNQPRTVKPHLGKLHQLPPRERKQDFFSNIPYPLNPFFTGREKVLEDLHEMLSRVRAVALSQIQAISGLGGIGKTQTAVEYTYRYRHEYTFVCWIRAETEVTLLTSYLELAQLLGLVEQDLQDPDDIIRVVRAWMEQVDKWLLIFDNADHPEILKDLYPRNPNGHILLTSRAQVFDSLGISKAIALPTMLPEEAVDFLFKRTGRDDQNSSEHHAATQLAAELGYLPLALEQASAYMLAKTARLQDYLASYRMQHLAVLNKSLPKTGDYPATVATTWSINLREVEKIPVALDLLRVSAFLGPDDIPLELIARGSTELGPVLSKAFRTLHEDPLSLNEALEPLARYSLIRLDINRHSYSIHRLIQAVVKDEMKSSTQHLWAKRVVRAVNRAFPKIEVETWSLCEQYLPHALVCAEYIKQWDMIFPEASMLLNEAANYLEDLTEYEQAEPLYQRALAIDEQVFGPEHPNTATSLNNLAELYYTQGQYEQSEPLYQRALVIAEQVLGPDHPDTAMSLNNLAMLYSDQGKYEQAEPLLQRGLAIAEQVLGPDHPDTARSLNNLALLYRTQGQYEQAEPLLQRALAIYERQFGPDHPNTATSLNNLALLYYTQGQYEQAEPLYQRALVIAEQVLGPDHPDTALSLNNLAGLYYTQGQYEQAEPLLQRALAIYERKLGPDHPDTAMSLNNLAGLYYTQGQYEQAEPLLQRALAIYERQLGPDHPDTARSLNNLALLYRTQGQYEQAEPLLQRALAIYERQLGPDHPNTALSLNNLAGLYYTQGQYEQAEPLLQRALAITERQLGPDHPDTAMSLNNLSALYYTQGQYEQAEPLLQRALAITERQLGPDHPDTAMSLNNLAGLYYTQGQYEQAEPLYQRAIAIYTKTFGPEHPGTKTIQENYARFLEEKKQNRG